MAVATRTRSTGTPASPHIRPAALAVGVGGRPPPAAFPPVRLGRTQAAPPPADRPGRLRPPTAWPADSTASGCGCGAVRRRPASRRQSHPTAPRWQCHPTPRPSSPPACPGPSPAPSPPYSTDNPQTPRPRQGSAMRRRANHALAAALADRPAGIAGVRYGTGIGWCAAAQGSRQCGFTTGHTDNLLAGRAAIQSTGPLARRCIAAPGLCPSRPAGNAPQCLVSLARVSIRP